MLIEIGVISKSLKRVYLLLDSVVLNSLLSQKRVNVFRW